MPSVSIWLIACLLLVGTSVLSQSNESPKTERFKLFRTSLVDPTMKVEIATFGTENGAAYNFDNCWLVAGLLQAQDDVKTRFWCEPDEEEKGH